MRTSKKTLVNSLVAGIALGAGALGTARAAEEPSKPAPVAAPETPRMISGSAGLEWQTHFMSNGYDVWGGGTQFGNNSTINASFGVKLDFDAFAVTVGTWWDVNSNVPSLIGGQIQEIDVNIGLLVPLKFIDVAVIKDLTFGITYGDWMYAGSTETILDLSLSLNDAPYLGAFAMNPSIVAHHSMSGGEIIAAPPIGQVRDGGWCIMFGIAPGLTVLETSAVDVALSFPVTLAVGDEDFYAESGFAYFSIGANLDLPLKFVPKAYGAWKLGLGLAYYHTDEDAIPTNSADDFITGKVGLYLNF